MEVVGAVAAAHGFISELDPRLEASNRNWLNYINTYNKSAPYANSCTSDYEFHVIQSNCVYTV